MTTMTTRRLAAQRVTYGTAALCVAFVAACSSSDGPTVASESTPSGASTPVATSAGSSPSMSPPAGGSKRQSSGHASSGSGPLSVVPTHPAAPTKSPVPIHSMAPFGGGVSARIVHVAHGTSSGNGPGEIAGQPQVTLTVVIKNGSPKSVPVDTVQVTATYANHQPAVPSNDENDRPLAGELKPGRSTTGTYSFVIPTAEQKQVTVAIWYRQDKPTLLFQGSVR